MDTEPLCYRDQAIRARLFDMMHLEGLCVRATGSVATGLSRQERRAEMRREINRLRKECDVLWTLSRDADPCAVRAAVHIPCGSDCECQAKRVES